MSVPDKRVTISQERVAALIREGKSNKQIAEEMGAGVHYISILRNNVNVLALVSKQNVAHIQGELASKAIRRLEKILDDADSPDNVAVTAAKAVLDMVTKITKDLPQGTDFANASTEDLKDFLRRAKSTIEELDNSIIDITPPKTESED